jgi:arginase
VPELRAEGAARTAQWARDQLVDCTGFWLHVDVDVLDPAVMPAVDAPSDGGIAHRELELLIAGLVSSGLGEVGGGHDEVGGGTCLGLDITVFDPDHDPDGLYAAELTETLVAALAPLLTPATATAAPIGDR